MEENGYGRVFVFGGRGASQQLRTAIIGVKYNLQISCILWWWWCGGGERDRQYGNS